MVKQPYARTSHRRTVTMLLSIPLTCLLYGATGLDTEYAAERLLVRLCTSLIDLPDKQAEPGDRHLGGILCPSRNPIAHGYHARAGEAVLPFAVCFERAADPGQKRRFLNAALRLGDWLTVQQQSDGSWIETPHTWWGTTPHQLFTLAAARLLLAEQLEEERAKRWNTSLEKGAGFVAEKAGLGVMPLSFLPTAACALHLSSQALMRQSHPAWQERARTLIRETLSSEKMDGLFVEEPAGGVDVGATWGQTIPLLALYAVLSGDPEVRRHVAAAAERHQVFLWPDGTVDASWGLRVHSWTLWGSFGTYGPVAGLSLLGNEKKAWRRAAGRSLTYLSQCLAAENQGQELLGYGPHASLHSLKRDICIYPTVCTAVGLAIALNWGDLSGPVAPPPGKQEPFAKIFPSCQIAVVHTKGLYTTLSWSSRRRPAVFPPRGGAISHLHLAGFGTVQCASPSLFVRRERLQTPRQKNVLPLTPRIEIRGTDTWYANIFDTTTECEFEEKREESDQDLYQFSFRGSLCDPSGRSSGVRYRLKYRFGHHYLRKTLTVSRRSRSHAVVVREPFVPDVSWPQPATAANSVRFGTARNSFRIALESPSKGAILEHAGEQDRFYFPLLPSVRATPIEIRFTDPAVTKIRWILERL